MRYLFEKIFQRIFNQSPSYMNLFDLTTLFFRFRNVEKELEKIQSELGVINQQHNNPLLSNLEARISNTLSILEPERNLNSSNKFTLNLIPNNCEEIDSLIKPLCNSFNEKGFFTISSCSGHVSVTKITDSKPFEKECWYILFTTQNSLDPLMKNIKLLEQKNIKLTLNPFMREKETYPFPVYKLSGSLRENLGIYNEHSLYQFNKNIYLTLKDF